MKKRTTFIITLIAIMTALTACGTAKESSLSTSVEDKPQATTSISTTETTTAKPAETTAQTTETTQQTTVQTTTTTAETTRAKPIETTAPAPVETTVQTTAVTVHQAEPVQAWTESEYKATMYVNESCYSRENAIIGAYAVKSYSVNTKVSVIAKTNTGYFKLADGTFIHEDYLSKDKVKVTASTTAKPKPVETTSTKVETDNTVQKVNFTVLTTKDIVPFYESADCVNPTSWSGTPTGSEYTVIEIIENKNCYKIEEGYYLKKSDVKKGSIEKMYSTFDIKAIKQYIIDDAVKNYGLVYLDDPTWTTDNGSWSAPTVISTTLGANIIKRNVEQIAGADFKWSQMKKGDYFNVYIQDITEEYGEYDENGKLVKNYAIFFLRG